MRGDNENKKSFAVFRTLATALVLSVLVTVAALIFVLYGASTPENRLSFMLPFAIPFGVYFVVLGALSVANMSSVERMRSRVFLMIAALAAVAGEIAAGVLTLALFNNISIGVSLIFIAACLLGLDVVSFLGRNEEFSKK